MAKYAGRPVVLIEPHVVEGRGILRPHHRAGDVGDDIGDVGAAVDDADARRIKFRPGLVGEPGEQTVVGRMLGSAEPEERLALGERVAVEQELLPSVSSAGSAARSNACRGSRHSSGCCPSLR